jgi:hypothetical protein
MRYPQPGLPGPPGPPGPSGDAAAGWVHEQNDPATTWTVVHGLGYFPAVTAVDTSGREQEMDVQYVDDNSLVLRAVVAVTGKAYLS